MEFLNEYYRISKEIELLEKKREEIRDKAMAELELLEGSTQIEDVKMSIRKGEETWDYSKVAAIKNVKSEAENKINYLQKYARMAYEQDSGGILVDGVLVDAADKKKGKNTIVINKIKPPKAKK